MDRTATNNNRTGRFPPGFLWGAGTAAFQVEGGSREDGKGPSIWDVFCHTPGKCPSGHTGDVTCDHYHRVEQDIELMRRLKLRGYRFSISWPRVLPAGRGKTNERGLDFYDRLVDRLVDAGVEPMVTLYHWDLPEALQFELGGWIHADLPNIFADYAEIIFNRLGDRVRLWLTINEPWCVVDSGYFHGVHAPGIRDRRLGYLAGHNMMRAHAYAAAGFRAGKHNQGKISLALNAQYSFPATPANEDAEAAERAMLNLGGWFGDPAIRGDYPDLLRERLGSLLPEFSSPDQDLLRSSTDFIALNYYSSEVVRHAAGATSMEYEVVPQTAVPHTQMDWPIRPDGLRELLLWLKQRYGSRPIYITENGAAFADEPDENGFVDDQDRIAYLRDHSLAVHAAMRDGVDVRGYFAWSLMDNLEWSAGFTKRFGLVRCDFKTLKRIIKASGHWYARMIEEDRTAGVVTA